MIVAIHQPNYLPWLGYFYKIARSDVFMFLDDAQFSKNGYINRVQVHAGGMPKWLTVPISYHLGDPINTVQLVRPDWMDRHLNALQNYYRDATGFRETYDWLGKTYGTMPEDADLATTNRRLIEAVSEYLGIDCRFTASSALGVRGMGGDDRLIALLRAVSPEAVYLSGRGGAKYQDERKFRTAGIGLHYTKFEHPVYDQGSAPFTPGLSVLDPLFHLGRHGVCDILTDAAVIKS